MPAASPSPSAFAALDPPLVDKLTPGNKDVIEDVPADGDKELFVDVDGASDDVSSANGP